MDVQFHLPRRKTRIKVEGVLIKSVPSIKRELCAFPHSNVTFSTNKQGEAFFIVEHSTAVSYEDIATVVRQSRGVEHVEFEYSTPV